MDPSLDPWPSKAVRITVGKMRWASHLFSSLWRWYTVYVYIYIYMYDTVIQASYLWFSWIFICVGIQLPCFEGADVDGHGVEVSIHLQTVSIYEKPCYLVEHIWIAHSFISFRRFAENDWTIPVILLCGVFFASGVDFQVASCLWNSSLDSVFYCLLIFLLHPDSMSHIYSYLNHYAKLGFRYKPTNNSRNIINHDDSQPMIN